MKFSFSMKSKDQLLRERGLEDGGAVQSYIDSNCIRLMKKYTPKQTGELETAPKRGTVIGSGLIVQRTPYAHYQYTGVVYGPNFPVYDELGVLVGWRSPPRKYKTDRKIDYSKGKNKQAGPRWFERMKSKHATDILQGAAEKSGGKIEK